MSIKIPFWLQDTLFIGREENDEGTDESNDSEDDGEENEDEGQETGSDGEDSSDSDDEVEALKKALSEERKFRRKAEREARQAKKHKGKTEEDKTLEQVQQNLTESEAKTKRLAERLLNTEITTAITAEATRQEFIDPTDALNDEVRKLIEADQDPEDPADIEIDEESVKAAVAKYASKKKHLVRKPNEGEPSGGRFNRTKRTGEQRKTSDQALQDEYPSLR